jgi:hypothetical protein
MINKIQKLIKFYLIKNYFSLSIIFIKYNILAGWNLEFTYTHIFIITIQYFNIFAYLYEFCFLKRKEKVLHIA